MTDSHDNERINLVVKSSPIRTIVNAVAHQQACFHDVPISSLPPGAFELNAFSEHPEANAGGLLGVAMKCFTWK